MDIVERLIAYRDRAGRSREGRDLLAEAANEIDRYRKDNAVLAGALAKALNEIAGVRWSPP
jgi:hypothetical protein